MIDFIKIRIFTSFNFKSSSPFKSYFLTLRFAVFSSQIAKKNVSNFEYSEDDDEKRFAFSDLHVQFVLLWDAVETGLCGREAMDSQSRYLFVRYHPRPHTPHRSLVHGREIFFLYFSKFNWKEKRQNNRSYWILISTSLETYVTRMFPWSSGSWMAIFKQSTALARFKFQSGSISKGCKSKTRTSQRRGYSPRYCRFDWISLYFIIFEKWI